MCHYVLINLNNEYNMTQKNPLNQSLPLEITDIITILGERIRLARTRRSLTMEEMASRMFITRKTLSRLEKGKPGVSLAVLASALWVLGLENDLKALAIPEQDTVGMFHEQKKLPKRVRPVQPTEYDELDF